ALARRRQADADPAHEPQDARPALRVPREPAELEGHLALDAAHQGAQPQGQAPALDGGPVRQTSSPEGAVRAENARTASLWLTVGAVYDAASSSNHTRATPSLRSAPQRSAMRSRMRQPMPLAA